MIFSAFRRAHRCPTNGSLSAPRYSSIAASQCLLSSQCHQRRHSSSKPPVPPNDQSAEIETSVKSVNSRPPKNESSKIDNSKPETEKRSGAESRLGRRKGAKESISEEKNLQILNLPAVPNTNYLHEHGMLERIYSLRDMLTPCSIRCLNGFLLCLSSANVRYKHVADASSARGLFLDIHTESEAQTTTGPSYLSPQ